MYPMLEYLIRFTKQSQAITLLGKKFLFQRGVARHGKQLYHKVSNRRIIVHLSVLGKVVTRFKGVRRLKIVQI